MRREPTEALAAACEEQAEWNRATDGRPFPHGISGQLTRAAERLRELEGHNKRLAEKVYKQKFAIQVMHDALRERNLQLDAWHWVWCDGGCEGGVHRWLDEDHLPHTVHVTEAVVQQAERGARRLRSWYENHKYRESVAYRTQPAYRTRWQRIKLFFQEHFQRA